MLQCRTAKAGDAATDGCARAKAVDLDLMLRLP